MPPETEYKKWGAGGQTITIQYAGFYPAWWLLLRFVSENCLKLHTTFSDTQLTQRVAYHQRESQYCTTQYDDCHKGIFCQHVLPPCKEETNIRIATFEREPQLIEYRLGLLSIWNLANA